MRGRRVFVIIEVLLMMKMLRIFEVLVIGTIHKAVSAKIDVMNGLGDVYICNWPH